MQTEKYKPLKHITNPAVVTTLSNSSFLCMGLEICLDQLSLWGADYYGCNCGPHCGLLLLAVNLFELVVCYVSRTTLTDKLQ